MKIMRIIPRLLLILLFLGIAVWISAFVPYAYACSLETQWSNADPKTKRDLEKYLHLYSERIIDAKSSMWGHNYALTSNERMVQYMILWSQPLDVVYDDQDNIKMIYTSYE